jgi:hypothetical protein
MYKMSDKLIVSIIIAIVLTISSYAQDEESGLDGEYLENSIVERNVALRLRGEAQFTDSDMALVDSDINYARFPVKIYNAETKLFQNNGSSVNAIYSRWQNNQGMDSTRWSWKMRYPIPSNDFRDASETPPFLSVSYWTQVGEDGNDDLSYWYIGLDKSTANGIYSLIQYRNTVTGGESTGHQLSEYSSWRVYKRLRIGEQLAISKNDDSDQLTPWYAKLFTTIFLVPNQNSLRLETQYYDSEDVIYQEYNTYLYQRLGKRSLVRLNYRYYIDSDDIFSNSMGIKLKHYFSNRISAHIGYRIYDHSEDLNLDTFFGGFNILL